MRGRTTKYDKCPDCGFGQWTQRHFDACRERERKLCRLCRLVLTSNADGVCTFRSEAEDRMLAEERRRSA